MRMQILLDSPPEESGNEVAAQPRRAARRGSGTGLRSSLFDLFNISPSVVSKRLVIDRYLAETKRFPY